MKTYNLIYDKSTDLEQIIENLVDLGITINHTFSSLGIINISSETENFSQISGVIDFEEDIEITTTPALPEFYWHQLRIVSRILPMKDRYIPKHDGTGVSIYLVDSGINSDLNEFSEANIVNLYSYNEEYSDDTGHGTAMASVMVGKTLGVSPGITLKNVKISMGKVIHISDLLTAFDAILVDKSDSEEIAIINCSWTITKSRILDTKLTEMLDNNFLIVAAAGNTLQEADKFSPIGLNSVLGVGASDAFDRVISWGEGAGSNWGPEVDLFAPGIDVNYISETGELTEGSGTSLACAITSAAVAQYINEFAEQPITAYQLQFIIINSSIPDALFRNEEIYENTPNRLLYINSFNNYIKNIPLEYINVKKGETFEFTPDLEEKYVSGVSIDDVRVGNILRAHPEWITLNNNIITISPPIDINSHRTYLYMEILDNDSNSLGWTRLSINIYEESPDENKEDLVELYFEENGEIVVRAAACTSSCFTNCYDVPPTKADYCGCSFYTCFTGTLF
jgi:subtilisin family serine protease